MTRSISVNLPRFIHKATASCSELDPELFFSELSDAPGSTAQYRNEKAAKAICAGCPLLVDCLQYALEYDEYGIWGGTTERDRTRIRSRTGIRIKVRNRTYS